MSSLASSVQSNLRFSSPNELSSFNTLVPITQIAGPLTNTQNQPNEAVEGLCRKIFFDTIDCLLSGKYSSIDPLTTSNCCHGMALRVRELVEKSLKFDLPKLKQSVAVSNSLKNISVPEDLVHLSQLKLISQIRFRDPVKGSISRYQQLQQIEDRLSGKNCQHLGKELQVKFSNEISELYHKTVSLFSPEELEMNLCEIPIKSWGIGTSPAHIRTNHEIQYAPSLYSTMVVLSKLSLSRKKVAILNDIICPSTGNLLKRYVKVLEGDGKGNFIPADLCSSDENSSLMNEPVVIFGGCAVSSEVASISDKMDKLISSGKIPNLILGSETYYPMYPEAVALPESDRDLIVPQEHVIHAIRNHRREFSGVSNSDPSFWLPRHYFVASLREINQVALGIDLNAVRISTIPTKLKK